MIGIKKNLNLLGISMPIPITQYIMDEESK
jgi:hypothetical protein